MRLQSISLRHCIVAALLLGGCGSDSNNTKASETTTQELVSAASFWRMNDCSAESTILRASISDNAARRAASSSCVERPGGFKAVALDADGERLMVPQSEAYRFGTRLAVAAWVNPSSIDFGQVRTIFRQGTGSGDVVALQIAHGTLELVLNVRVPGASSTMNIRGAVFGRTLSPGWMHVGAIYDGSAIRLFIDGQLVSTTRFGFQTPVPIAGDVLGLEIGGAPLLNGNSRQFFGAVDDVWLSTEAATAGDMAELFNLPSCPDVDENKELLIRDLGVVEDPVRTTGDGVWTFKHLMEAIAPTPDQAPAMVEQLFQTWLTDQTINGHVIPARPAIQELVFDPWPRINGELDLSRSPVRLLAVVNRLDLRNLADRNAGEGRFIFGVIDNDNPGGTPHRFTLILEYRLPATTEADVLEWANLWHELNALTLGSAAYNGKLAEITERFAGRNAEPQRVNGSALGTLRSNEIELGPIWELREFRLAPGSGFFQPETVKLTPDTSFMGQAIVADFINQNEADVLAERHTVPEMFQGAKFLGGSSFIGFLRPPWNAPGINSSDARHKFSLNTCNGCHGDETSTVFTMVSPRFPGSQSDISAFLEGIDKQDPFDPSRVRPLHDLDRRAVDMQGLLCADPLGSTSRRSSPSSSSFIARGIARVH